MGGRGSSAVRGKSKQFSKEIATLKPHHYLENAFINPIPYSENADRASHIFGDLDIDVKPVEKELNVSKLKSAQDFIYKEPLVSSELSSKPITVLHYGGEYIVFDGNHRALKAIWKGDKKIRAKIWEL